MAGDQGDSGHGNDDADGGAMDQALRSAALMYAGDRAAKALGISIDEVAPGRATARMRVTGDMTNGHRIAHGGYIFLVADAAFAYTCNSYGPVTVAQACQITFLRPAREGDELIAVAAERVRMERNGIYDISVRRADGEVLAELRGHSRTVQPHPGGTGKSDLYLRKRTGALASSPCRRKDSVHDAAGGQRRLPGHFRDTLSHRARRAQWQVHHPGPAGGDSACDHCAVVTHPDVTRMRAGTRAFAVTQRPDNRDAPALQHRLDGRVAAELLNRLGGHCCGAFGPLSCHCRSGLPGGSKLLYRAVLATHCPIVSPEWVSDQPAVTGSGALGGTSRPSGRLPAGGSWPAPGID